MNIYHKVLTFVVAVTLLASCGSEELAGDALSEGKYPLELNATGLTAVAIPETRSTVDGDWKGVGDVAVQVNGTGNAKRYKATTSNADKDATLAAATGETPFYWQGATTPITVKAWHPYSTTYPTSWEVDANQDGTGFVNSDLIMGELTNLTFANRNMPITFSHQTAKVVVNLIAGDGISLSDVSSVQFVNVDNVNGNTVTPMKSDNIYTALLAPQTVTAGKQFIKVSVSGTNFYYKAPTGGLKLDAGKAYTYDITVKRTGLELNNCIIANWGNGSKGEGSVKWYDKVYQLNNSESVNINDNGNYLITGNGTKTVTISGGSPTITLKDVNISAYPAIEVTGGNPTFILEGNNTLTTQQGKGALYNVPGTTIIIDGDGTLTANGAWNTAGIGGGNTADFTDNNCGKIIIKGGTISASSTGGGAAIGCGYFGKCDGIKILGGKVTVQTGNGYTYATISTIGTGASSSCTYIKLENCTIYSKPKGNHSVVRATTITPAYDNIEALKAAGVTIYVRDVLYTE